METNLDLLPLEQWGICPAGKPLLVAGPCSAESEFQIMETARKLIKLDVHIFRAGIWKPRTRPNSFEGVGKKGLPWLQKVKRETGMLVATEVANRRHVEEALYHEIDVLWIGARSTANPFVVQEIATALENQQVIVLIKNPVNPEIDLWVGAIERIRQAGITRIGAVHRGFSTYEKSEYRNKPIWPIPIELMQRIKGIALLSDPSHICGNRDLMHVLQNAIDLNYSGFMIEVHHDPDYALSDARQQITPGDLKNLFQSLKPRTLRTDDEEFTQQLELLRCKIDELDNELLEILKQRMTVSETIGHLKLRKNITILQPDRWADILTKIGQKALEINLNPEFIRKTFKAIHEESINRQTKIMNDNENKPA